MKAKKSTSESKSARTHGRRSKMPLIAAVCIMLVALVAIVAISGNGTSGLFFTGGSDDAVVSATEIEAMSPMEFPDEAMVVTGTDDNSETGLLRGTLSYKVKGVEVYDNLYEAGLTTGDLDTLLYTDNSGFVSFVSGGAFSPTCLIAPYYYDGETGQLMDNLYLLLFEVEITNVDASCNTQSHYFNYTGTGYFYRELLPKLYDAAHETPIGVVYLREDKESVTQSFASFEVQQGETQTLHIGYIMGGNAEDTFSHLVIYVGSYLYSGFEIEQYINMEEYSDLCYAFNLTDVVEDFKSSN